MNKMKKLIALLLCGAMVTGMAACGSKDPVVAPNGDASQGGNVTQNGDKTNTANNEITIGTWWVQYYDSSQTALEDDPTYLANTTIKDGDDENAIKTKENSKKIAQLKFDNVKTIENKYGVKFYWDNLTYPGVKDSINTSILAGTPDCDIYLVDTGMAIPAQMNGLALDLKTVLPADHDLFTTQTNCAYMDLGDGKACIFYRQEAQKSVEATYPLGFNIQMLEDYNLEDPRELYARGEWTWDKFVEYCKVLTKDTDGDGQVDQYGYCGYENETLENLVMSNGANIATGVTEQLTSTKVGEALQMMYDLYNVYNVCYPYDYEGSPSDSMRNQYTQGNIGFFPIAAWISAGNGDYDYDGSLGYTLPFDIAYVRWPVGPNGNQDTNAGKNLASGEFYMIPSGVSEPEKVFNVIYDMWNWYAGDTSIRDDKTTLNWWYKVTASTEDLQEKNFNVMKDCGEHTTLDLWNSLGIAYDLQSLMKGNTTPAQFQETYKQTVQDALDAYFGN